MTDIAIEHLAKELFAKEISKYKFTFAKTMPKIPHEWLARRDVPPQIFDWLVATIYHHGQEEMFYRKTYKYLYVGDHKYWCMGNPISQTTIINRAKA